MKIIITILLIKLTILGNAQGRFEFKNEKDSASYAAGLNEGERMMQMLQEGGADTIISQDLFLAGLVDIMTKSPRFDNMTAQMVLQSYFGKFQAAMEEKQRLEIEKNQKLYAEKQLEGTNFLAENSKKTGVKTTASGLQYKIDKKGKGKNIKLGDKLKVHYTGRLLDGSLIDSSREGEPFEFDLADTGLIQGWIEGLQLMNKGAKFTLYIPYNLGYGEAGMEPQIPPYSLIIFELEIVEHIPVK